jgi:hypothetical protein
MRGGIVLVVLSSLFWSAAAQAQLPKDEQSVLRMVIAAEARMQIDSPWQHRACVDPVLFRAFDRVRTELKRLSDPSVTSGEDDAFVERRREQLASGRHFWHRYVAVKGGWTDGTRLPRNEEALLTAAVATFVRQASRPGHGRIDQDLPAPLFYGERSNCPMLRFSEPAIQNDLAFVETVFDCGPLCAFGQLYALRRDQDGWRIVAVTSLWES